MSTQSEQSQFVNYLEAATLAELFAPMVTGANSRLEDLQEKICNKDPSVSPTSFVDAGEAYSRLLHYISTGVLVRQELWDEDEETEEEEEAPKTSCQIRQIRRLQQYEPWNKYKLYLHIARAAEYFYPCLQPTAPIAEVEKLRRQIRCEDTRTWFEDENEAYLTYLDYVAGDYLVQQEQEWEEFDEAMLSDGARARRKLPLPVISGDLECWDEEEPATPVCEHGEYPEPGAPYLERQSSLELWDQNEPVTPFYLPELERWVQEESVIPYLERWDEEEPETPVCEHGEYPEPGAPYLERQSSLKRCDLPEPVTPVIFKL
jgi:hypothetical protein